MLVIDGNGLPLGFYLDRANTAEVRLAEATLGTISVSRLRGRPRQCPEKLVADRAYDSSAFRAVPPRHRDVHSAEATPGEVETQAGTPSRRAQRGVSVPVSGIRWNGASRGWATSGGS
jgi:hypothetical protein